MKKIFALVLVLVMALSSAGFTATADALNVYHDYQTNANEMEFWLIQMSQGAKELNVLNNCFDGLVYNDNTGALVGLAAESWSSDDSSTAWTFKLHEDMLWADVNGEYKGDVTSADWLTGVEWVLNFAKNEAINSSMLLQTIQGAQEYYDYTKALAETDTAAALALGLDGKFAELVGVKAPDEYTIEFTCLAPTPYFDSICTYACLYPLPQGMIDELGIDGVKGITPDKLWYNGPYTVTSYNQASEKTLTRNPLYWNEDAQLFDAVVITMVEDLNKAYELFDAGQLDRISLTQSKLMTIYNDTANPYYNNLVEMRPTKYSYQIHFCFDTKNADGSANEQWNKAVANEAFRLSWYYGLDLTAYHERTNPINPKNCANYTYTGAGVSVNSQGVDYTQLVREQLGLSGDRYDPEKAAAYKAQAIEELTAQGVTFPIEVNYYFKGDNTVAAETAKVLKQTFADCLGEDYVTFNMNTYISSLSKEVAKTQLASFYINGWGADFGDPVNFLGQETYADDNAYYSDNYSKINLATDEQLIATYKEFTAMVNEAHAIVNDPDARYDAFAKAEAFFVSHALAIPCLIDVSWQLTKVNDYTKSYAAYGISSYRYENWETSDSIYTTAQYEAIKEAYYAGK